MSWFKLDDQFPSHPKLMRAGTEAAWLFVAGGCYCAQHLTDGMIPKEAVPTLTTLRRPLVAARALVTAGLWIDEGTDYRVHDYLEYNPTREQVLGEREKRSRAGRKGARARWGDGASDGTSHSTAHDDRTDDGIENADAPGPVPPDHPSDDRAPAPFEAEFEEVWYFWPRKLDKAHALEQYQARRRAGRTQAEIMRAIVEFTEHAQAVGTEVQYLPYLKTFIGARGQWVEWLDGVPLDAVTNEQLGASAWSPEPASGPTLVPDPEQRRSYDDERPACPLGECDGSGWIDVEGSSSARRCAHLDRAVSA